MISVIEDTTFYYNQFADYFDALNRGGLQIPNDNLVQWAIFCLIVFEQLSDEICRIFLSEQFLYISQKYKFSISIQQCRILANIFLKNYSLMVTFRLGLKH